MATAGRCVRQTSHCPPPDLGKNASARCFGGKVSRFPCSRTVFPLQVSGRDGRLSTPLTQETGLFRTLANTRPDREGVCQFASRFGLLGIDAVPVEVPFADRPDVVTVGTGELLTLWQAEIASMREVLELLDLTQRRDTAALATRVRWTDDGVIYQGDTKPHVISSSPTRFLAGDLIGPAVHYVQGSSEGPCC